VIVGLRVRSPRVSKGKVCVAFASSQIAVIWQREFSVMSPKGLRLPAQGCRIGYPGKPVRKNFQPHAVASFSQRKMHPAGASALRLGEDRFPNPG